MSLYEIIALLILCLVMWLFWQTRSMAELAKESADQHCDKLNLQLLALGRIKLKPSRNGNGHFCWRATYQFEFSSDGESFYMGYIIINGNQVIKIEIPAYRVAD